MGEGEKEGREEKKEMGGRGEEREMEEREKEGRGKEGREGVRGGTDVKRQRERIGLVNE